MEIIGRFAPSPTGRMHLGNVFCAMLSWLSAKSRNGKWLLRIEDLDPQRCKRDYALTLMDDLEWLGLRWDGDVIWQSQRSEIYQHYLDILQQQGRTYYCKCTRADIMSSQAPHQSDGRIVYPGTCRSMGYQDGAIRLIVPEGMQQHCGDFIIRRADGAWAYQLAVVVDDGLMGVTEVVRGCDLLTSVPQQEYLYQLLGLPCPQFYHHPLLCNSQGQRLCKRDKALDLGVLRKEYTPHQILGKLAYLAGLCPTPDAIPAEELLKTSIDYSKWKSDNKIILST